MSGLPRRGRSASYAGSRKAGCESKRAWEARDCDEASGYPLPGMAAGNTVSGYGNLTRLPTSWSCCSSARMRCEVNVPRLGLTGADSSAKMHRPR